MAERSRSVRASRDPAGAVLHDAKSIRRLTAIMRGKAAHPGHTPRRRRLHGRSWSPGAHVRRSSCTPSTGMSQRAFGPGRTASSARSSAARTSDVPVAVSLRSRRARQQRNRPPRRSSRSSARIPLDERLALHRRPDYGGCTESRGRIRRRLGRAHDRREGHERRLEIVRAIGARGRRRFAWRGRPDRERSMVAHDPASPDRRSSPGIRRRRWYYRPSMPSSNRPSTRTS
jgi:hypothetical protein